MSICAGLDVSDKTTHICVVDVDGKVLRRDVVASDPFATVAARPAIVADLCHDPRQLDQSGNALAAAGFALIQ
ncbi:hypothetical protein WSK_3312 [Novosphingobium sp. Rr 2-17]|nr:hypothetical protein WSK_3312 [Novosphingobium sp. Rr 2-17]